MQSYLVLLRGINVGGKALIKMAELKTVLEACGFKHVVTYIQSGNVLLDSDEGVEEVAARVRGCIRDKFGLDIAAIAFSQRQWKSIITVAPSWWGKDSLWKHNLLILIPPYIMSEVIESIGNLKPDIEFLVPGESVLYQSMSLKLFGKTTTGKLASNPIYKQITVRNYNTATKLLALLMARESI